MDGNSLTTEDLSRLGLGETKIAISEQAWTKLGAARAIVDSLESNTEPSYGINTGFGKFSNVRIPNESLK